MERNDRLIRKKIYKYMFTGVMTTVALQLGNVVDAMIVGHLLGSIGNAAVSAAMPYIYLLQAAMILLSGGGAVVSAVLLGKHEAGSAGKIAGFCFLFGTAYPLLFAIISPAAAPWYVNLTGAKGELAAMVSDYISVYSLGMPFISFAIIVSSLMNIDNHPSFSSGMNIVANAVNLVCDYILVKYTLLGIKGAALSTIIGYVAAGLIYIPLYIRSKDRMIKPSLAGLSKEWELKNKVLQRGMPNLSSLVLMVIGMSILNRAVLDGLGAGHYAAYAVTNNTQHIVQMFLNGISSVIASVAGVLYGERDYFGMRGVLKKVLKAALVTGVIIMAVFLATPQLIAALYGFDNAALMPELLMGLRIFSLSFFFYTLNALAQNYYRTIGQTYLSLLSTAMQLLFIRIPLMLLFLSLYGFVGLFAAIVLSELISFVLLNLLRMLLQRLGRVPQKGFMAIPDSNSDILCDISIRGSDEKAVQVSERVIACCQKDGLSEREANMLGLAAEELVSNIATHGYKEQAKKDIDVCLSKTEGRYYLRIRDDGIPFDPVSYEPGEETEKMPGGLTMLKKMAINIHYMRTISLNNTIIEVDGRKGEQRDESISTAFLRCL